MIRRAAAVLFLLVNIPLYSQILTLPSGIGSSDLEIDKESWNIGVSSFSGLNLDIRYEYLLNALPLLLHEEISSLGEHILTDDEKFYFRHQYLKERTISLEKEKSLIHGKRDALLFSDLEEEERKEKYEEYSDDIGMKEDLFDFWSDLAIDELIIKDSLPVSIEKFSEADSRLLVPRVQVQRFMESEDLDLLVSGTVERLDNMFFLSIEGIMQYSEEPVYSLNRVVREEDINDTVKEGALALRSIILGRTWSELLVTSSPDNALILIDGESRGVGSMSVNDLRPGYVTLSLISDGYRSDVRQLYLKPEETLRLEIELEPGEKESLFLFSEPPGADVYFGATWVGQTPLLTEKPDVQSRIRISKENYMPFYGDSNAIEGDSLTIQLGEDIFDKQIELKKSKSRFYKSMGWFSMSVAVPLILSGVYQNLNNRYYNYALDYNNSGDPNSYDKAVEYKRKSDIAYYSMWGGIAISGTLLVNTIFKLRDYIRAAEKSTED